MNIDGRVVFVDRRMTPDWLTPTQAGVVLAGVVRPGRPAFTRLYILKLIREGKLSAYDTPHGRLLHAEDLVSYLAERHPDKVRALAESTPLQPAG